MSSDQPTDQQLYDRLAATLVASWAAYATGTPEASIESVPGASAAVFPSGPERAVYNNALLDRGLDRPAAAEAASAIARVYAAADVERYAIWVHDSESESIATLAERGLRIDTSNRAMAMRLDDLSLPHADLEPAPADLHEHLRIAEALGAPKGLLAGVDPAAFEALVARPNGRDVATGLAYDHDGDRGIFNLGTRPDARRRGLGTTLTALLLDHGRQRGCATASVQASQMAEGLFAALGFRDLGRFIEYVP
jgi:ribosomal protein S18 acetylase RimI-like enzyme